MKTTLAHWLAHQDRAEIVIRKDDDCLTARVTHGLHADEVVLDSEIIIGGDVADDHGAIDAADEIIGVLDDIVDAIDDVG